MTGSDQRRRHTPGRHLLRNFPGSGADRREAGKEEARGN